MQMKTLFAGTVLAVLGVGIFMAPVEKVSAKPIVQQQMDECCWIHEFIEQEFPVEGLVPIDPNWSEEQVRCVMAANEWYLNQIWTYHRNLFERFSWNCPTGECPFIGQVSCSCLTKHFTTEVSAALHGLQDEIRRQYEEMIAQCDCVIVPEN